MKKKVTGLLMCMMLLCMSLFAGCSLVEPNYKDYYNQAVAVIEDKETGEKIEISKKDLISAYQSYGYYTRENNQLFTPVIGQSEVNVYILVKHWTQENDPNGTLAKPSSEWLKSDIGALQTTMVSDAKINPQNNNFYSLGLIMDLTQFKVAWDAAGGDGGATPLSEVAITRSPSGTLVREFTLENAKVICDVY